MSCVRLAWDSCFSAVLEKRKAAKEKAAQQSEGAQLLGGVGTVPAEVFCLLLSFLLRLGRPCKTASLEVAAPGLSQLEPGLRPTGSRPEEKAGRCNAKGEPKVPRLGGGGGER